MIKQVTFTELPQLLQDRVLGASNVNESRYEILKCELSDDFAQCFIKYACIIGIFSCYRYGTDDEFVTSEWLSQDTIEFLSKQFRSKSVSGEPTASSMGKLGGSAKTKAKSNASKENGKLGGRPKKVKPE